MSQEGCDVEGGWVVGSCVKSVLGIGEVGVKLMLMMMRRERRSQ